MGVDRVLKNLNANMHRQLYHVNELLNRPPSPPPPTLQDNNIISKNEPNILMTSPTLIPVSLLVGDYG